MVPKVRRNLFSCPERRAYMQLNCKWGPRQLTEYTGQSGPCVSNTCRRGSETAKCITGRGVCAQLSAVLACFRAFSRLLGTYRSAKSQRENGSLKKDSPVVTDSVMYWLRCTT